jgi:hypothetical protein
MSLFRKIVDSTTWVVFFVSVMFSMMTLVAQNSIPGDSLYGFKLGYEKVMLASSRFLNKQVDVQIEFVARRFDETTRVLASQYGSESLNRLNGEVESTAYTITMISDPAEKKVAAKKYIAQLNVISTGLGQQKQNFVDNNTTVANQNPTLKPTSSSTTSYSNPTVAPTTTPAQNTQIVEDIDNTQATIEETIEEMENLTQEYDPPSPPTSTPVPTATPIPPTPTTIPEPPSIQSELPTIAPTVAPTDTFKEKVEDFCTKHPDKCGNNNDNQEEND